MTTKKLSLEGAKRPVLEQALQETADTMDRYMRRIYDDTREQVR